MKQVIVNCFVRYISSRSSSGSSRSSRISCRSSSSSSMEIYMNKLKIYTKSLKIRLKSFKFTLIYQFIPAFPILVVPHVLFEILRRTHYLIYQNYRVNTNSLLVRLLHKPLSWAYRLRIILSGTFSLKI